MKRLAACLLIMVGTAPAACKKSQEVSAAKSGEQASATEGRQKGFVNDLAGRTDAKVIREKLAQVIGADPQSEMFNIQFGLYRCTLEALISAATMGQGGTAVMPLLDIGVSAIDILHPLFKAVSAAGEAGTELQLTWFDMVKVVGNTIVSIVSSMPYDVQAAKAASDTAKAALQPTIEKMLTAGIKLTFDATDPMVAGRLQTAVWEFFKANPEKARAIDSLIWEWAGSSQFGSLQSATAANARAAALSVALPLLRCTVAIGEGVWALGKQTYGLGQDLIALRESAKAVTRACPRYNDFVQCTKTCGGQGVNSDFANTRASSRCDQDPVLGPAYRGLVIGAFQASCYELYCKGNQAGPPATAISQPGQCMIAEGATGFFAVPGTSQRRSLDQMQAECCDPSHASVERCAMLAAFGSRTGQSGP